MDWFLAYGIVGLLMAICSVRHGDLTRKDYGKVGAIAIAWLPLIVAITMMPSDD